MSERNLYIDYLRLAATIGVVLWHSTSNVYYDFGPGEEWHFANFMFGPLVRWSVPCFVMLSGALLLSRDEDIANFYKKRLTRIFIPVVTWTLLYGVARLYYFRVYEYNHEPKPSFMSFMVGQFRDLFFNDLSYHLYFISIILGLYLITPFIRAMVKNISRHQLEILLLVCIGLISLKQFYPNVLFVSHFQIGSSLMYFLLGYYLHTYELTRRKRIVIYILGGIGALAMTFGNYVLEYKSGSHHDQLFLYDGIFVVLLSTWVFMLFRYGFKHATTIGVVKKFILRLSSYSYGVYIAHPLVISFLWYSGVSFFTFTQWESTITFSEDLKVIFMFHGAWGAVVMTLIVFSCSSLVLYLADRAKVLKLFS